jgi:hypothetical protein
VRANKINILKIILNLNNLIQSWIRRSRWIRRTRWIRRRVRIEEFICIIILILNQFFLELAAVMVVLPAVTEVLVDTEAGKNHLI